MARLASAADFYATWDLDGNRLPGTGVLYDEYKRYPFFGTRADLIAARFPTSIGKVVVFGCGFGYLVDELVARGYDAWGVDAAAYARSKATELLPDLRSGTTHRVVLANMATPATLNTVRTTAGLTGNQRFAVGISEDVLPCAADAAEVRVGLESAHGIVSTTAGRMVHFITCTKPNDLPGDRTPVLLWLSRAEWRALINTRVGNYPGFPGDLAFDCEGYAEF